MSIRVWFALILLFWRPREESVSRSLNAQIFLVAAGALRREIETLSDCGWLFNPFFPDAGKAEGFASLESDS
jgi:hypothetical protein